MKFQDSTGDAVQMVREMTNNTGLTVRQALSMLPNFISEPVRERLESEREIEDVVSCIRTKE